VRQRASCNVTVPLAELNAPAPRVSVGPYTIVAPLAKGGTGTVFLAEHETTKERVALKMLYPAYAGHSEVVDRMFVEHEVSNAVAHYALLDVRAAATTTTGLPYLVMEYLDGENLGMLAERGRLEIDAIIAIATQISGGLAAMHRAGYVHCDIKPDNILVLYQTSLDGWPLVKVIDYGVAAAVDAPPSDAIAGTPAYMPPEQWRGRALPKSDVYALGCTLYELLTGEQPFQGTLPQLMLSHSQYLAELPSEHRSDVPPALEKLIMRMLSKEPAMRPTATEVEAELQRVARASLPLHDLEAVA
jgi:eukaryotic-like serine/threonine-protein kinase